MTKEIKNRNCELIREGIREARKQGYTYKLFADSVGMTVGAFSNFMCGIYNTCLFNLRQLQKQLEKLGIYVELEND